MNWTSKTEKLKLRNAVKAFKKQRKKNYANQKYQTRERNIKELINNSKAKLKWSSYKEYLLSGEWDNLRKQKLRQVGSSCQICNSKKGLHIHHRTYARIFNERLNDLTVLCGDCHALFHQISWSEERIEEEVSKLIMGSDIIRYA